jgi:hypothetical protein
MNAAIRTVGMTLALFFVAAVGTFAADANLGTWKLNEGKSTLAAGAAKNSTVMYEAAGDSIKVTIDGTDAKGAVTHSEWTGKFDGHDYAVTGDPTSDMRSYTRIGKNTLNFAVMSAGKVGMTGRILIAGNGKTRTVTSTSTDAMGAKLTSTAVFDKQ